MMERLPERAVPFTPNVVLDEGNDSVYGRRLPPGVAELWRILEPEAGIPDTHQALRWG